MVNKPHAPRASNSKSSKKPVQTAATVNGEDTSYIVFSNAKDSKKGNKNAAPAPAPAPVAAPAANAKGGKDVAATEEAVDAPKKPTTREIIGGSSWTGKLPLNFLAEHCQKQKWEKPEYTMSRSSTPPGQISSVILKQKNNKTQETTTLPPMSLPKEKRDLGVRETAVEARHLAAAYALFRVASGKNLHMMMPPQFRDLWKGEFTDMKRAAEKEGMGWLYADDPFKARKEWEDDRAAKEKKRVEIEKKREKEKEEAASGNGPTLSKSNPGKAWTRAPKVEMSKKMRRDVEGLVRHGALWNPHAVDMPKFEKQSIVKELSELGFRQAHVEEAAEICKDREEVLEWLLIHVPEDDLPKWSLPEGYTAGVSLGSSDLAREGKLKRLAIAGYAAELCEEALDACSGDEALAAERLQSRLLGTLDDAARSDPWDEEREILESIFSDRLSKGKKSYTIILEVVERQKERIILHARKPSSEYPNALPILSIEASIPAYIRLSILKQALLQAQSHFLGEQMLFNIVDWLEREIPAIIKNPGRLSEIASVSSTSAETTKTLSSSRRNQRSKRMPRPINWQHSSRLSQRMQAEWQAKRALPAQQRMMQTRQNLPAWNLQEAIVDAVMTSQVTIISGETGSGKSTQSVQFVLDDMIKRGYGEAANIICTQPRRISALGLADRVADERCAKVGEEVGYAIRGESKQKSGTTKITFVTTGVLLRRLQTSGGKPQDVIDALADVSHVVIDEVHERSLDTDFLMVLLRDVLKTRKDLKLILMSATLDAAFFKNYFAATSSVSMIEIPGRTHPVTDIYLDDVLRMTGYGGDASVDADNAEADNKAVGAAMRSVGMKTNYDLIAQTVECIDQQLGSQIGGILIFLPGVAEIDRTLRAIQALPGIHALPLHAGLQSHEQKRVFPPAPAGKRKVIAATNVAETSITIEDVVAVIDTGRVKETSYDPVTSMVKLEEVWASRAACKQRRGRAGRVRAGTCYKLYTRNAEQTKMAERPDPEILRVPLEQLCLSVKAMGVAEVATFLASAITPPSSLAVSGALRTLHRMGALDGSELTALGRHLSMIPADLRCGKLLVYGATFGCLEATLTIAAILTGRSPFVNPPAKRDEAKAARSAFGVGGQGDLICDLRAYETWAEMRRNGEGNYSMKQWCDSNYISQQTLFDISTNRRQYLSSLQEIGFIPFGSGAENAASKFNAHNTNYALLRCLIAAAFTPQIARIDFPDTKYAASVSGAVALDPEARTIKYFKEPGLVAPSIPGLPHHHPQQANQGPPTNRVFIHPSSTLFTQQAYPSGSTHLSYFSSMQTAKSYIHSLTPLNTYSLLLFGGPISLDTAGRGLLVDGWIRLRGWARIGVLVSRLRILLDRELEAMVEHPSLVSDKESKLVGLVRRLVELDGLDR
ncbi:P-loop containing nucleoside triphosphate hydrolase protein [Delphinella strobiligena]|nr:P-loop containing nucleoside triphosphate hydrolase protein [Delphinella strobiligena]